MSFILLFYNSGPSTLILVFHIPYFSLFFNLYTFIMLTSTLVPSAQIILVPTQGYPLNVWKVLTTLLHLDTLSAFFHSCLVNEDISMSFNIALI